MSEVAEPPAIQVIGRVGFLPRMSTAWGTVGTMSEALRTTTWVSGKTTLVLELLVPALRAQLAGEALPAHMHDVDLIRCADWVINMGPGGGIEGGRIVAQGTSTDIAANEASITGRYLR